MTSSESVEMFLDQELRRGEATRHAENSARLAQEYHKFESFGQGFLQFEEVCSFDVIFVEEPFVSYGSYLDLDELGDLMELEAGEDPMIPVTTGVVTEWDRDDRDFYVGAWVAVRVYFPSLDLVPTNLDVHVNHYFTFTGTAMKDVPLGEAGD